MTGFGLVPLKQEGAPIHPDEFECDITDEKYLKQLQRYADWYGLDEAKRCMTARVRLLDKLT